MIVSKPGKICVKSIRLLLIQNNFIPCATIEQLGAVMDMGVSVNRCVVRGETLRKGIRYMPKKMCEICKEEPATVPDRERMGRLINRICHTCHAKRLSSDLARILKGHKGH